MKEINKSNKAANILRIIILAFLAILIFYPPYARGLYYFTRGPKELLAFHVMSFSLFMLFLIYKWMVKDYAIFKAPIDYAAAGLVAAYFLPIMFSQAANLRVAIGVLLQYANYFIMYLMVRDTVKSRKELIILLNVMLASAVGIALVGIDSAAGEKAARVIEKVVNVLPGVNYKIFGGYVHGRMNSMLQYANTLASYLLAAFILSTGLIVYIKNRFLKHIYTGVSFILLLTFVFTYSRGVWLMFPIVFILFILLLRDVYHVVESIFYAGAAGIVTLGAIPLFYKYVSAQNAVGIWRVTAIGFIAAVVLSFVLGFLVAFLKRFQRKHLLIAGGGFIAIMLIVFASLIGVALNVEKPVELVHAQNEKDSTKAVSKVVDGMQANTEYILRYDAVFNTVDEKKWAYKIVVDSIDAKNKAQNIGEFTSVDLQGKNEVMFRTLEDTEKVNIKVINYYAGTDITLQNAVLTNTDNHRINKVIFRYKYIPDSIAKRFDSIDMQDQSVNARFAFYKDALKIIKDYPIIGAGGGGWASLYFMYQSYMYWSTQTHNYFMQLWIEAGTLGLLIMLAFVGLFIIGLYRCSFRKNTDKDGDEEESRDSILAAMLGTAVLSLLGHSIIDFDLSLSSISLMMWALIAFFMIVSRNTLEENQVILKRHRYEFGSMALISIGIFILVINLQVGYLNEREAVAALKEKDSKAAVTYLEKAVKRDPFNASYRIDLGRVYDNMAVEIKDGKKQVIDKAMFEKAEEMMKKALELEPYNSQLYANAAAFMISSRGNIDKGLEYLDKSIEVQPLRSQNYQQKADVYYQLGIIHLNAKRYEEAEKAFKEVLHIPVAMREVNQELLKPISLTEQTMEYLEKSDYLLGNYKNSEALKRFNRLVYHSYMDADTSGNGLPDTLAVRNYKGSSLRVELTNEKAIKVTNAGKEQGLLMTRKFSLHPNTKYMLTVELKGQLENVETLDIYVASSSGKYIQFHTNAIALKSKWNEYSFEFNTTTDISSGDQFIRFDHNGKDKGYVEVRQFNLYSVE